MPPIQSIFGGDVDLNIQTSGIDASKFMVTAIMKVENAYLTTP